MNLSYYKGAVLLAVGVLVGSLVMIGCDSRQGEDKECEETHEIAKSVHVVKYGGHEYLVLYKIWAGAYGGAGAGGICHSESCPCRKGTPCDCRADLDKKND